MERLQLALSEIQGALQEHKRQAEDAQRREAELHLQLESERAAHRQREAALLEANARLLSRVDELSTMVTKLQSQVVELTRTANQQIVKLAMPGAATSTPPSPRSFGMPGRPGLPPASTFISTVSPINNVHLSLTNIPKSPGGIDGHGVLAAIDKSLDNLKVTAAEELERYTDRLRQHSHGGSAAAASNVNTELPTEKMIVTPPAFKGSRSAKASPSPTRNGTVPPLSTSTSEIRAATAKIAAEANAATKAAPPKVKADTVRAAAARITPNVKSNKTATSTNKTQAAVRSATKASVAVPAQGYAARAVAAKPSAVETGAVMSMQERSKSVSRQSAQHAARTEGVDASQPGIVTPARPEVRAAPYDDYRMEANRMRGASFNDDVTEHHIIYDETDSEDERASPARAEHAVTSPPEPAKAIATMSAAEFFGLLRAHVPPVGLQKLMMALAKHQQGEITREQLMQNAAGLLRPTTAEVRAAGLQPAATDLLVAFDAYLHK